ncbi:MAG TPA: GNAT family N-acetyltransferase [Acidobacteriaceae bacterium]
MTLLETERLLFRPHEPADRDAYCAMEQDPEVRRYVGGAPRTREAAEAKFQGALQPLSHRLRLWATILKANGAYIGRCGVYPHVEVDSIIPGEGVLAFYLARPYWGQGLATEAGAAFVRFGFNELGLHKIVATVQEGNRASIRVLEKLGFHLVRVEPGFRTFHHFALPRPDLSVTPNHASLLSPPSGQEQ